jgi:predicted Zn-dependent protease
MVKALAADPRNIDDLLVYGEACLRLQDPASAAPAFDRAESLMPGNLNARIGRGWARLLLRQPQEAAALWRPVVGVTRDSATLQRMIALYEGLGDAQAAAEARASLAATGAGK